jgi:hypothetical protein
MYSGESSNANCSRLMWRKFWKIRIPGKVKHFLWRAYHDCLPTNFSLHKRRIRDSPCCSLCHGEAETIPHILWQCPLAQNTWAVSKRVFSKMPNRVKHFSRHFSWILSALDKESILEWTVITWSIWKARNQFIFHKTQQRPELIRDQGLDLLKSFHSALGAPPGA